MLTHAQIWAAIDAMAKREGLTPSSLARRAGLDSTTFNPSKRRNSDGQLRWPSTESIAKVLAATGATIDEFFLLVPTLPASLSVPFHAMADLGPGSFDAHGLPATTGWDTIAFPNTRDNVLFALEIGGNRFSPCYRDGDIIILTPKTEPRRGDRIFVMPADGKPLIGVFARNTTTHCHLTTLMDDPLPPLALDDILLICRIVWASQ